MDRAVKVLVTGGAGYIGSHTAVELLNLGYEVLIVDNFSNSRPEVISRIEMITGKKPVFEQLDLLDEERVKDFFDRHSGIECVINFAASKAVGESVQMPLMYYRNNLMSLVFLLQQMQAHDSNNLIFSSSCTVYGQPDVLPVTESTPFKAAESPYGKTKQMGEEIIRDSCNANSSLHAIALRYFNPVGAHPTALIGELPNGTPSNLVPFITQTAAGIRDCLSVFGDDYDTPDGSALRDFIHVVDLARAHVAAVKRLVSKNSKQNFEFFNVGTGKPCSVLGLIQSFERVNQVKLNYKIVGRRKGDIEKIYADTTLANNELKWHADQNIDDMMRSAWHWQLSLR